MTTNYNFRIIASMSDYDSSRNARFNTRPLINKIGCTEYRVWKDGLSKDEAYKEFEKWASEEGFWYDEAVIGEGLAGMTNEDGEPLTAEDWMQENRWYEGPGWYADGQLLWNGGSEYYHDDVWTFEIEEVK